MTVTASGPDGAAGSYRILIQAQQPPRLLTAPLLAGPATIGTAVGVDPGTWEEAAALALQWCRDGAEIAGATGASYTPVAADDRTALSCRVTASNPAGSTAAETAPLPVTFAAPAVAAALADLERPLDSGSVQRRGGGRLHRDGAELRGLRGRGDDRRRDRGGRLPTAALVAAATVTVTASNSGGSASVSFKLSVVAVAPALVTAPKLTGSGKIGAAVGVDAGTWSGKPAPSTALQWRRDGAEIAGATGASYTPVAADDRTALSCRVTATNLAGSAVATTAALAVTRVAPVASGTLADVELIQGAAAGSVAAAAAFTGAGPELRGLRGRGDDRRRDRGGAACRPRRWSRRRR